MQALNFVRAFQKSVECHLGGGTVCPVHGSRIVSHRVSRDIDLFCQDSVEHRALVAELPHLASGVGARCRVVRDGRHHVRATLEFNDEATELDLVFDPVRQLELPPAIDEIKVQSLLDLRANKLTCLLSRAEPRDLVDVLFLERSGFAPEHDLGLAIQKDSGMDPGIRAPALDRSLTAATRRGPQRLRGCSPLEGGKRVASDLSLPTQSALASSTVGAAVLEDADGVASRQIGHEDSLFLIGQVER